MDCVGIGVGLLLTILVKIRELLDLYQRIRRRRPDFLLKIRDHDNLDEAVVYFLEEYKNRALFKEVTGISADRTFREKIKRAIDESNGMITAQLIINAGKYVKEHPHNCICVEIGRWDLFAAATTLVLAAISMLLAGVAVAVLSIHNSLQSNILILSAVVLLIVYFLFILMEWARFLAARTLQKKLEAAAMPPY